MGARVLLTGATGYIGAFFNLSPGLADVCSEHGAKVHHELDEEVRWRLQKIVPADASVGGC